MHSVLDAECNGCALCLPACPVDCIALVPVTPQAGSDSPWPDYTRAEVDRWRVRSEARLARLKKKIKSPRAARGAGGPPTDERARIRAEIHAAVARVRAKKSARSKNPA
jgi:electron transport complex protein RnfB